MLNVFKDETVMSLLLNQFNEIYHVFMVGVDLLALFFSAFYQKQGLVFLKNLV